MNGESKNREFNQMFGLKINKSEMIELIII